MSDTADAVSLSSSTRQPQLSSINNLLQKNVEESELTTEDSLFLLIEALTEEARKEAQEQSKKSETNNDTYSEPYTSGSSMIWRITDQLGIDSEHAIWWFAALSIYDDGSPFCLIFEKRDQIRASFVQRENLENLVNAFEEVENHYLKEEQDGPDGDLQNSELPPLEIEPERISEDSWETVVSSETPEEAHPTLAIRRAPVLDHRSLGTYVVEQRKDEKDGTAESPIGALWGHHAGLFAIRIEEALERLSS